MHNLPNSHLVPIGKAAEILGVSIDTLRRWDKSGKVNSVRPDGKDRYFDISQLEKINANKPLSISEASRKLGVSSSTLRRYEQKGILKPKRNEQGERVYDIDSIHNFSVSPAPKADPEVKIKPAEISFTPKPWQHFPAFIVIVLLVTTMLSTLYVQDRYQANKERIAASTSKVLGAKDQGGIIGFFTGIGTMIADTNKKALEQYRLVFSTIQKTIVERTIVEKTTEIQKLVIDDEMIKKLNAEFLQGKEPGTEEGDLAFFASGGRISALRISSVNLLAGSVTSDKIITDAIISSKILNDTIKAEDIAVGAVSSSEIEDGTVSGSDIKGDAIDAGKLASTLTFGDGDFLDLASVVHDDSSLQGLRLPNTTSASPTNPSSGEGYIAWDVAGNQIVVYNGSTWGTVSGGGGGSGDITSIIAGNGLSGGGITGDATLTVSLTSTGTTGSTSSSSGLEVSSSGLTLLKGCADNELLKYTDAGGWACATDSGGGGGGIVTIEENDVTVVSSATNIDFLGTDFTVGAVGTEGNISIDYANSEITRNNQSETIINDWTFTLAEAEDLAINWSVSGTQVGQGQIVSVTNSSSSGNQYGIYLDNTASTGTTDSILVIDNSDTDTAVTSAIQFVNAGGGFTNLFDVAGTLITSTEFTILDGGMALSELTDSGNFIASGDITMNDVSADTILIGQSGATDDTVTIAGNVSITDDNWAISATGVGTGLTANDLTCTNCIGATEVDESGISSTGLSDTANIGYLNQSETVINDWTFTLAGTEDLAITHDLAGTANMVTLTGTPNASANTAYGIYIDQANSANANGLDAGIVIDNSDTSGAPIVSAIKTIDAGAGFTNLFDINGTLITSTEFTILDGGIAISELTDSGNFVASGNVTFNDAGADTITIGDINDNVSITDAQWAISDTGVGTGLTANDLSCTNCIGATEVDEATIASTSLSDTADIGYLNQSETVINDWTFTLAGTEDLAITHDLAGTANMVTLTGTPNASANTAYGIYIDQANSVNANGLDAGIVIDNSDTSGAVMGVAIKTIDAGAGFTNLFDINGTLITSTEFTVLDGGILLSELTNTGTLTATTVDINGGAIDGTTIGASSPSSGSFTTLASTGITTIGNNTATVAINSDDWDIDATGAVSGVGSITSDGAFDTSSTIQAGSSNITLTLAEGYIDADAITLAPSGTTGSTSSRSGLQTATDGLSLLMGCTDGQLLEWSDAGGWACGDDNTSAGAGIGTVQEQDVNISAAATTLDFLGADFVLTDSPAGEVNISIDYANSEITRNNQSETVINDWTFTLAEAEDLAVNWSVSGTQAGQGQIITTTNSSSSGNQYGLNITNADSTGVTEAGIVIDNADTTAGSLADGILITSSGVNSGITDGIDVSAANIDNAINIGANAIAGTNFSVTGAGALTVTSCSGCGGTTTKYLATPHDIASTTATEVTGISTTLTAGTYVFKYSLIVQSTSTTVGLGFGINYTGTTTSFVANERYIGTGTAASTGILDDTNTGVVAEQIVEGAATRTLTTTAPDMNVIGGVGAINVDNYVTIEGVIIVSDTGDLELWHNSEAATQTSVMAGSTLVVSPITAGADLAEIYGTMDPEIEPGDVVALDSSLKAGAKKSERAYDGNVLGIVSTSPGLVTGTLDDAGATPVLVALSGRVPVKVTAENGAILPGDLLTSSSIPGVAMKATKAGAIIGQAMTAYEGEGVGTALAFVKNDYGQGVGISEIISGVEFPDGTDISKEVLAYFVSQKSLGFTEANLSEMVTDRLAAGLEIITPKLVVDEIFANVVHADKIYASQVEGLTFLASQIISEKFTQVENDLNAQNASDSASLAGFDTNLTIDSLIANKGLTVYGLSKFMDGVTFSGPVSYLGDVFFERTPTFNKDTAGFAVIKEGTREVYVPFENEYIDTPVVSASPIWDADKETVDTFKQLGAYVLPLQDYIVASVNTKGFTIILGDTAVTDLKFSWFALAVKEVKTINGATPEPTSIPSAVPTSIPTPVATSAPEITDSLIFEQTSTPSASPNQQ